MLGSLILSHSPSTLTIHLVDHYAVAPLLLQSLSISVSQSPSLFFLSLRVSDLYQSIGLSYSLCLLVSEVSPSVAVSQSLCGPLLPPPNYKC